MADNYIERQQEQYEARKAAWKQAQKYGKKKTTTSSQVKTEVAGEIVSKPDSLKKRVFVTGGAEGIGRAIVEAFCKDGHQVAFCDINAVSGQQTARDTGAIFHPVDVSDKEALESCMQQILDEWKDIDILINNVGISKFSSITETSVEDFDKILSVNLRPVFITSRLFAIHRKGQSDSNPYGRIINISSGSWLGNVGQANYAASKAGVIGLTKTAARELASRGIRVNAIAPGFIETDMTEVLSDKVKEASVSQIPLGHFGKPEDVANLAAFLASEAAAYITGQVIHCDGGMVI